VPIDFSGVGLLQGEVAEWQTRTVQVRVPERAWGFNSPLPHQMVIAPTRAGAIFVSGPVGETAPVRVPAPGPPDPF
jgi:hypothetical protein